MREVWRGGVNAWDCDEMGHMNSRFYIARAMEGVAVLMALLGRPGLFAQGAATTVLPGEMHVRFHRECTAGTALRMEGGLLSAEPSRVEALLMLYGVAEDSLRATVRIRLDHVSATDGKTEVRWDEDWHLDARDLLVALPPEAAPRGVTEPPQFTGASSARAEALGLRRISMGTIEPASTDVFGRMMPHMVVGAVSDGMRTLSAPFREIVLRRSDDPPARLGGAVLEMRILHLGWPRAGACHEVRSGLQAVEGNVRRMVSWMLDPVSGEPWGVLQAIGVDFDLDRRRIFPIGDGARAELQALCVPELTL